MMRRTLGIAFFAAWMAGCQLVAPLPAACLTDTDCPGTGQLCSAGQCVPATACTPRCENRPCGPDGCGGFCGACAEGEACDDGRCVPACPAAACPSGTCNPDTGLCRCTDESCASGRVCNHEAGDACTECRTSDDCGGMPCLMGRCAACANDAQCAFPDSPGRSCIEGRCLPCGKDADCVATGQGKRCVDHACVACGPDTDCGTGKICVDHACQEGACAAEGDARCGGTTPHCLVSASAGTCVACVENGHCQNGDVCTDEHRCAPPPQCGPSATCPENWQRCNQGRCVRCVSSADCGGSPCDASGECQNPIICTYDHDCRSNASGPICRPGGQCGCNGNADCAVGVCDLASHRCAACSAQDVSKCPSGLNGCVVNGCVECDSQADCAAKSPNTSCDLSKYQCVPPGRCPLDRCGSAEPDGYGGTRDCRTNCSGGKVCNANGDCELPGTPPAEGAPCRADADCGTSGLKCLLPTFPGSTLATGLSGICVPPVVSGNCPPGGISYVKRDAYCIRTCSADGDCPGAGSFCAGDRTQTTPQLCLPGCRTGSCDSGKSCDPYSRQCVTQAASSVVGQTACTPGVGSCAGGQTCLPRGSGGVCATACSASGTSCLCVPGLASGSGACQPAGPAGASCLYDADCSLDMLCTTAHTCAPACDGRTGGMSVASYFTCQPGTCTMGTAGWKEASHDFGACQPMKAGKSCSSAEPCATGEECRWMLGGIGQCVKKFDSTAACASGCPGGLACVPDPDGAGTATICTRGCNAADGCGAGLACTAGGCTPACSAAPQICNPDSSTNPSTTYSCQVAAGPTGFRCTAGLAHTLQPDGATCQSSADCLSGTCAAVPYAIGGSVLRCRRTCGTSDQLCANNPATACLVATGSSVGMCATSGQTGLDGPCASSDDCTPTLVCVPRAGQSGGTCRPSCRIVAGTDGGTSPPCDAGMACVNLDTSHVWSGGGCDPATSPGGTVPWCSASPAAAAESCNFCDDDGDAAVDEDFASSPASLPLPTSAGGAITDVETRRFDLATDGQGFVTVYAVEYSDRVEVRMLGIHNGNTTSGILETLPKNGRQVLLEPRLSVAGPLDDHAPASVYVAFRFFGNDGIGLKRFFVGQSTWDSWAPPSPLTATGNNGATPKLAVHRSGTTRLVGAAYRDSTSLDNVFAWTWCSAGCANTTPSVLGLGSTATLRDLTLVPLPDSTNVGFTVLLASPSGVTAKPFTWNGALAVVQSTAVLNGSPTDLTTLQAASFPTAQRLVLVGRGSAGLVSAATDGSYGGGVWSGIAHAKAPFSLAPVTPAGQLPWALLAYVDDGVGTDQVHFGGITIGDGTLRIRRPFLAPGTTQAVSAASDGLQVGLSSSTQASAFTGCP